MAVESLECCLSKAIGSSYSKESKQIYPSEEMFPPFTPRGTAAPSTLSFSTL